MKHSAHLIPPLKLISLCILATAFSVFSYIETKASNNTHIFQNLGAAADLGVRLKLLTGVACF
jgi:hypothetical protein